MTAGGAVEFRDVEAPGYFMAFGPISDEEYVAGSRKAVCVFVQGKWEEIPIPCGEATAQAALSALKSWIARVNEFAALVTQ